MLALSIASDVIAGGTAVASIPIPDSINVSTRYPIAAIANSEGQLVVGKFIDFLLSPALNLCLPTMGLHQSQRSPGEDRWPGNT